MTQTPNVLIACEYSGIGRETFRAAGFNAISCDLEPTDQPGPHHQGDVRDILKDPYAFFGGPIHLMVGHPPCTYMANSGAKHLYELDGNRTVRDKNGDKIPVPERWRDLCEGAEFFRLLWEFDVPRIALENPVMLGYAKRIIGRGTPLQPTQTIQPWEFGHKRLKRTCLWLKNLPPLVATDNVYDEMMATTTYAERAEVHHAAPGPQRGKIRSLWYQGFADAMVAQWGPLLRDEMKAAA